MSKSKPINKLPTNIKKQMKNSILVSAVTAISLMASASVPMSLSAGGIKPAGTPAVDISSVSFNSPRRSYGTPETQFTATKASFYAYDDGMYYLFLSNTEMEKGNPTTPGQFLRAVIISDPPADMANPSLPVGTFEGSAETQKGYFTYDYTICLDVFEDPENVGSGELVAYQYHATDGTIVISEEEKGVYNIQVSFNGLNDSNNDTRKCEVNYKGAVPYEDINAYTPLEGDTKLNIFAPSGNYTEGSYSIAFYSDGLIDEEGWVVGAGQLMNMELFTESKTPMNPDDLVGVFTPVDMMTEGPKPGCFGIGVWYEMYGMFMPIGTSLSVYDSNADIANVGLAKDGTITITKDGDNYTVKFDLVSVEGHKITGEWTGDLISAITDYTSGVENIEVKTDAIYGGTGCVYAPADAAVFTISGMIVGRNNLAPGIYIVKSGNTVKKVCVK